MTDAALAPTRAHAAGSPWFLAVIVVVPTFMEVLDTTIAVVALRYIAGGLSATVDDGEWVPHQLPCRQRHYPADHRLAERASGSAKLLPAVDSRIHPQFRTVRDGQQPQSAYPVSGYPGPCGRRSAALQPGRAAGRLPSGKAGRGNDALWPRGPHRACYRPDARGMDHGPVQLAMGLLDQRARRGPGICRLLCPTPRPGLSRRPAPRAEEATVSVRTRSACRCWSSSWSAGK